MGVVGARFAGLLGEAGWPPVHSLPAFGLGAALKKLAIDFWPLAGRQAPPLLLNLPAMVSRTGRPGRILVRDRRPLHAN